MESTEERLKRIRAEVAQRRRQLDFVPSCMEQLYSAEAQAVSDMEFLLKQLEPQEPPAQDDPKRFVWRDGGEPVPAMRELQKLAAEVFDSKEVSACTVNYPRGAALQVGQKHYSALLVVRYGNLASSKIAMKRILELLYHHHRRGAREDQHAAATG